MRFSVSLKNNYEFRRLYSKGKSVVTSRIVVYARKNASDTPLKNRVGITVGTKIGHAVQRNLIRRRLREIYRLNEEKLTPGYDIVIVARAKSKYSRYSELEADFRYAVDKLGLTH